MTNILIHFPLYESRQKTLSNLTHYNQELSLPPQSPLYSLSLLFSLPVLFELDHLVTSDFSGALPPFFTTWKIAYLYDTSNK